MLLLISCLYAGHGISSSYPRFHLLKGLHYKIYRKSISLTNKAQIYSKSMALIQLVKLTRNLHALLPCLILLISTVQFIWPGTFLLFITNKLKIIYIQILYQKYTEMINQSCNTATVSYLTTLNNFIPGSSLPVHFSGGSAKRKVIISVLF